MRLVSSDFRQASLTLIVSVYGAFLETLIGHSSMVNTSARVEGVM